MRTATTTEKYPRPWHTEPTWTVGEQPVTLVFCDMASPTMVFEVPRELTGLAEYLVRTVNAMPQDEFERLMGEVEQK